MIGKVGFKLGLGQYGVELDDLDSLAAGAMAAKRLWSNKPRCAMKEDVQEIFRRALTG